MYLVGKGMLCVCVWQVKGSMLVNYSPLPDHGLVNFFRPVSCTSTCMCMCMFVFACVCASVCEREYRRVWGGGEK